MNAQSDQSHFEELFLHMDQAVLVISKAENSIQYANRAAEALLGHDNDTLVGQSFTQTLREGIQTLTLIQPNGKTIPIEARVSSSTWLGWPVYLVVLGGRAIHSFIEPPAPPIQPLIPLSQVLEKRNRDVALLGELGGHLTACLNAADVYDLVRSYGPLVFGGFSGGLYMHNPVSQMMERVANWGEFIPEVTEIPFQDCLAVQSGKKIQGSETWGGFPCKRLEAESNLFTICYPLIANGESIGVLHLRIPSESVVLVGGSLDYLDYQITTLADQIAMTLSNLVMHQTLQGQSIRDPLTGLFNRNYFEETIERELRRAVRYHRNIGLVHVDIDHFEQFNRSFGPAAGDSMLRAMADYLRTHVRSDDIACRCGSSEIILVLVEASLEDTCRRAELLRMALKNLRVVHEKAYLKPTTVSMGVSAFPQHGGTTEELLQGAREALELSRQNGYDMVSQAPLL